MRLVLVNKPFHVLPQFTDKAGRATLRDYVPLRGVYPAGRLDYDSEGLLLLTDDGALQARIANPRHKLPKTYWAQVEGLPTDAALAALRDGVDLGDFVTKPAGARLMDEPPGRSSVVWSVKSVSPAAVACKPRPPECCSARKENIVRMDVAASIYFRTCDWSWSTSRFMCCRSSPIRPGARRCGIMFRCEVSTRPAGSTTTAKG